MFNFKNREEKKYRGTTLYVTKLEDVDVERLLAIVFGMIEGYAKQDGKMPEKIVLSSNNYNRIMKHNKTLIERKDGKEYILGVEIEVERDRKRR